MKRATSWDHGLGDKQRNQAIGYASDVGALGVLRAISRLRGLILLPIIARGLGPAVYGAWTQSLVAVSLGTSLIDLQLHSAVVRFVSGTEDRAAQRAIFLPSLLLVMALGTVLAIVTLTMPATVAVVILGNSKFEGVAALLGLWIALAAITQLSLSLLQGMHRVKISGVLSTGQILAQLVAVATVILLTGQLLLAVWSAIGVELAFALIALGLGLRQIGLRWPRWGKLRANLAFSLPLVPTFYSAAVLASADRLFIAAQLGSEAVGVYAAAYSLARILRELFKPIRTALLPAASRSWDQLDRGQTQWLLSNTLRYYLLLALPALVGLALLGPRIVTYLASAQIAAAGRNLIPFLGLGLLLASLQNVFAIVLQLVEETRPLALARVLSASVYVLMVLLAVPRWGLFGGAVATALGYALDAGLSFLLAWRRLKFRLPGSSTAKALLASGLMIPVVLMLDSGSLSGLALAVAGGIMIYSTLLVVLRAVGRKELAFVQMILSSPSSFSQEA